MQDDVSFVFRVNKSINEFHAEVGSHIVYRPLNPISKIQVVRHMPAGFDEYLLKHYGHLTLLDQHPSAQASSALEHLYSALQKTDSA